MTEQEQTTQGFDPNNGDPFDQQEFMERLEEDPDALHFGAYTVVPINDRYAIIYRAVPSIERRYLDSYDNLTDAVVRVGIEMFTRTSNEARDQFTQMLEVQVAEHKEQVRKATRRYMMNELSMMGLRGYKRTLEDLYQAQHRFHGRGK